MVRLQSLGIKLVYALSRQLLFMFFGVIKSTTKKHMWRGIVKDTVHLLVEVNTLLPQDLHASKT